MSNNRENFLSPVGRLVVGSTTDPQTKDAEGRPLVDSANNPRVNYVLGIAVAKTDPGAQALIDLITGVARKSFPSLFDANGVCIQPTFSWKITDGDSAVPNSKGKAPNTKEGYPGHWVFVLSSGFAPRCWSAGGASEIDPTEIKTGYYVRIQGNVAGNGSAQRPGVYLNHNDVELVGYGETISNRPDGSAMFGATPVAHMPAGMATAPPAPAAAPAGQFQAPAPAAAPVAAPAPVATVQPAAAPVAAPAPAVTPAMDIVNGPAPVAPVAAPAPAVVKYIADGNPYTAEQLKGFGFNDAQIAALPQA